SLAPRSPDERIAVDVLLGRRTDTPAPDAAIVVVNALHPEVGLYLLLEVRDLGIPVVACVNIADEAEKAGVAIDYAALARATGVPAVRTVAPTGEGVPELIAEAARACAAGRRPSARLPEPLHGMCELIRASWPGRSGDAEIVDALIEGPDAEGIPEEVRQPIRTVLAGQTSVSLRDAVVGARHRQVEAIVAQAVRRRKIDPAQDRSRRLDRLLTHPVLGLAIFLGVMAAVFFAMFWLAAWPMGWIESGIARLQDLVRGEGELSRLLADGVLAGAGAVVVFLPQIVILFLFLGILEDTGYMARAVVLLDRPMSRVGLSGRGFVPLLGSMACAVPGVMGARVIPDRRERLATIFVAPLMTCSARLPVYALLIGTVILAAPWVQALVLAGLYVMGALSAMAVAGVLGRARRRSGRTDFIVELPPYRRPTLRSTGIQLWHRVRAFLYRAGTVILGIMILLWFLSNYPKENGAPPPLERSIAGRAGKLVEPALAPLGHDWKTGIGLLTAFFSAREVYVGTMGTVYGVEGAEENDKPLREKMQAERDPATGKPRWTLASGISLMVFFIYAMLCSSTVVTVFRESGSWRWALLQLGGLTAIAWVASFAAYRIALAAGA
ncbi:MAG TPA: ferrous iron transport protein B, partial [Candidatus Eisenbacteria bacterium]|nr:ferrous iron transport protein B [Candidatus Eisenbacteria bacterium]